MSVDDTQAQVLDAPQKDTAEEPTSEASTPTNDTPEVTQETEAQEASQTEVKTEDTGQEEKLLAGKYKTVEDLEKAYKELNSKSTRDAMEKAELNRSLSEAFVPREDTGNGYSEPASQDTGVQRDVAVMKFMLSHGDADGATMKEVLLNDPMLSQISGYDAKLEYAYLRSQNMSKPKAIAEATKQAQVQTHAKIVEKQTAQVETARSSQPIDDKADLQTRMTTGDLESREAARREYIKKFVI